MWIQTKLTACTTIRKSCLTIVSRNFSLGCLPRLLSDTTILGSYSNGFPSAGYLRYIALDKNFRSCCNKEKSEQGITVHEMEYTKWVIITLFFPIKKECLGFMN